LIAKAVYSHEGINSHFDYCLGLHHQYKLMGLLFFCFGPPLQALPHLIASLVALTSKTCTFNYVTHRDYKAHSLCLMGIATFVLLYYYNALPPPPPLLNFFFFFPKKKKKKKIFSIFFFFKKKILILHLIFKKKKRRKIFFFLFPLGKF